MTSPLTVHAYLSVAGRRRRATSSLLAYITCLDLLFIVDRLTACSYTQHSELSILPTIHSLNIRLLRPETMSNNSGFVKKLDDSHGKLLEKSLEHIVENSHPSQGGAKDDLARECGTWRDREDLLLADDPS